MDNNKHEDTSIQKKGMSSVGDTNLDKVFAEIDIKPGISFADIGSGSGDYSFKASSIVGNSGVIYAIDKWDELAFKIKSKVEKLGVINIKPVVADILYKIPLPDDSIDICMIAAVLHGINLDKCGKQFFSEIRRILKPDGKLVIIEFKKKKTTFGPPVEIRILSDDLKNIVSKYGFSFLKYCDLSDKYMSQFKPIG